ncbi:MAG: ferritin-like domain-containing protein [Candidatus Limnocylindrales bacterium]
MPIATVAELRRHLRLAVEVELSTIPPYLYALWSIEDQASEAARLLKSIATEEMLHVALATNILLAVGGDVDLSDPTLRSSYPRPLPHHKPPLPVDLAPMSMELLRGTFMVIERPETPAALPEADEYETLGQFHLAVEMAIEALGAEHQLFRHHQPDRQLSDPSFYGAVEFDADDSGGLLPVADAASAGLAIDIIVHQGEGLRQEKWADPEHRELTHYHKLLRIHDGEVPIGAVRPALQNPRRAGLPAAAQPVADLFNALNAYLYMTLAAMFAGDGQQATLVNQLYRVMTRLLAPTARYLMTLPAADGQVAGPTFEPYALGAEPRAELADLAAAVAIDHPALGHVAQLLAAHH